MGPIPLNIPVHVDRCSIGVVVEVVFAIYTTFNLET